MEKKKFLISYNLQLFAEDGPGGEKTEEPTAKKIDDTRKEGQVARSQDLGSAVVLVSMFAIIRSIIAQYKNGFMETFNYIYSMNGSLARPQTGDISIHAANEIINEILKDMIVLMLPPFVLCFVVAFIVQLVQVKWKVSTKPMKPKFSKLNPISGFKKIFSTQSLMNLFKSVCLILIIAYVVYGAAKDKLNAIYNLYNVTLLEAITYTGDLVLDLGLRISVIYLIVGIVDYVFQKHKHHENIKMTKQEVKDEMKNTEGDPQIKGKIRQKMMQASQRRMMQSVPQADVVITNPTHYAVALQYDTSIASAPIVVAKGEDYLAQKIKETAREHDVEIVENKPLARMLYANVDVGEQIPEELYQTVAEILAFVYNLKGKI